MKKVIRLTESQLIDVIEKIINEEMINELQGGHFQNITRIKEIDPLPNGLRAGIAEVINMDTKEVRGEAIVIYYIDDNEKRIYGHGPIITDTITKEELLTIARNLLEEWGEEFELKV